jgi:hypothetical protein
MSKTKNKFAPEVRKRAVRMVAVTSAISLLLGGDRADRGEDWLRSADAA